MNQAITAAPSNRPVVRYSAAFAPARRPTGIASIAPISGSKTTHASITGRSLVLHQVGVIDGDIAAIAEEGDKNGEADGRFGGGDGQHHKRKHLARQIAEEL